MKNKYYRKCTSEKIALYKSVFTGPTNAYGAVEPGNDNAILAHLKGKHRYDVSLFKGGHLRAAVTKFRGNNPFPAIEFINATGHYRLPAHIEARSCGFHAWIFFHEYGVKACKARLVIKHILKAIGYPKITVYPKLDFANSSGSNGSIIHAPLFGGLVPFGKTVFIDPFVFRPYPDQWAFLESIMPVREKVLDDIIEYDELVDSDAQ